MLRTSEESALPRTRHQAQGTRHDCEPAGLFNAGEPHSPNRNRRNRRTRTTADFQRLDDERELVDPLRSELVEPKILEQKDAVDDEMIW
jgi:hypothetical protein